MKLLFEEPALAVMSFAAEEILTISVGGTGGAVNKPGFELPDDEFPF